MKNLASVEEQYRRFPEMDKQDVLKLKQWVQQQPHMPNLSELDVILFFHACYYSMELTKRTIETNLSIRTHVPEFFHNLDIERPELKRAMNTVAIIPLPKATPEGYRVIIGRLADTDTSKFNFADIMKFYCMVFDLWMAEGGAEQGHVIVMDLKGVTLGHVARLGLLTMKKFLFYLQEAAAIRLVGFHFVNIVPFIDKVLALMNPFMKKELQQMIQLHSNIETFYKSVPKDILPSDYGGDDVESDEMKNGIYKNLVANREFMMEFEKTHQINEKLRPGKPKDASDLFGVEGNFKKLDFD
ncbi:alpha-tocopherol transfer protein-like [Episyrphus balteatus]|uniref:alpha-tocopherol transfer protein-like n=1 Tax=Episyrphus balteatus TaxID=286459 RepID=UPI00248550D8|nr:alpha-tocopherol transfer protein-like [Episyrphus balteatus]